MKYTEKILELKREINQLREEGEFLKQEEMITDGSYKDYRRLYKKAHRLGILKGK